jgi:hypothetical protein
VSLRRLAAASMAFNMPRSKHRKWAMPFFLIRRSSCESEWGSTAKPGWSGWREMTDRRDSRIHPVPLPVLPHALRERESVTPHFCQLFYRLHRFAACLLRSRGFRFSFNPVNDSDCVCAEAAIACNRPLQRFSSFFRFAILQAFNNANLDVSRFYATKILRIVLYFKAIGLRPIHVTGCPRRCLFTCATGSLCAAWRRGLGPQLRCGDRPVVYHGLITVRRHHHGGGAIVAHDEKIIFFAR